ncbi:hypothetical protein [Rarobacter faecitabidus]|uniref:hypothetical protein n=1 Tax=Rarobacter faecitabidus TaxID=13243 RepID=UPI00114F6AF1|nr:hypothetical protein [Rarobacter faecitabidus]
MTLKDFADYLKVAAWADDASNGPALDEALNSAISWCEGAVGPLGVDEVTYRVEPRGSSLLLPAFDLQEVVSVVSPSGVEVTPTSVRLAAAIVTLSSVEAGAYAVTVRPRVLPADSMRLAIKLVGSQLFTPRRGAGKQAGAITPVADTSGKTGFAIPNRAAEIVAPYLLPTI